MSELCELWRPIFSSDHVTLERKHTSIGDNEEKLCKGRWWSQ